MIKKIVIVALTVSFFSLLSACRPYQPDIQQGNIITDADVQSIHRGMTPFQVEAALGSPVLNNVYQDNRAIYVYSLLPTRGKMKVRKLIIYFQNGRVSDYTYASQQAVENLPKPH